MIRLLVALLLPATVFASRIVTVTGRCEVKVTPDRASVQVSMEKTSPTSAEAVDTVSKKIESMKEAIEKMHLKDLELRTTQFQLSEHREWENNKNVLKGQRASLGLEVTTSDIKGLSLVMSEAAKKGLTSTSGFRSFLSMEKNRAEYLKCLDIAGKDALAKAQSLAKTLKADVGEVETIIETPPNFQGPVPMYAMDAMAAGRAEKSVAAPPIEVPEQVFSTTLQVAFKLK